MNYCTSKLLEDFLVHEQPVVFPCRDTVVTKKFYAPAQLLLTYAESKAKGCERVLEVGPGLIPFSRATHFIDHYDRHNTFKVDVNHEKLPFEDKYFDFVYCRHTLEDLVNPEFAFKEMVRVAKRGFFETPGPIVELCRGVDAVSQNLRHNQYKGYMHHYSIVYESNGVLHFAPKLPLVEYIEPFSQDRLAVLANNFPLYWNTYYEWDDNSKPGQCVLDNIDNRDTNTFVQSYNDLLRRAVLDGAASSNKMLLTLG